MDTCPIRCPMVVYPGVFPLISITFTFQKQFHIGNGFCCLQLSCNFLSKHYTLKYKLKSIPWKCRLKTVIIAISPSR
jgi:hypothetical protein